jgi:chromate reductase, NAD(P)H dehydrogenase (quinone)
LNSTPVRVLGFAGSLRKASVNRGLLRAASALLPEGMTLEIFDIGPIPLFNEDLLTGGETPPAVVDFKLRIAAADALLIATPEYNYSIPGVLKNAIDWASRPAKESPLNDKPLAIMGAGGIMGTSRAQAHLRQVAVFTNMHCLNKPELTVQRCWEKFDDQGNLVNEDARAAVAALLAALAAWTRRLRGD